MGSEAAMTALIMASTALAIALNAFVFLLIVNQDRKKPASQAFLASNLFVIIWTIAAGLLLLGRDPVIVDIGLHVFYIAPMFLMMFLTVFARNFLVSPDKMKITIDVAALWVLSIFFMVVIESLSSLFTVEVVSGMTNRLIVAPLGYFLYTIYFVVAFFITFFHLFRSHQQLGGRFRQQVKYVFGGMLASSTISLTTNLVLPLLGESGYIWIGPASTALYVIAVSVSIIRHGLFDIKFAAIRTLAYTLALTVMATMYFGLAYLLSLTFFKDTATTGVSVSPANIFLAFLLAIVFQPIKRFFDHITNRLFFRDRYDADEFLKRLSRIHMKIKTIQRLLDDSVYEIALTLKASSVNMVAYGSDELKTREGKTDSRFSLTSQLPSLRSVIDTSRRIIIVDELASSPEHAASYKLLSKKGIAMVLPLYDSTGPVGFVAIGEHKSSGYSDYDVRALNTIADELVIAMNNVRSLEKIHLINLGLQQKIDDATRELQESNKQLRKMDETKDEFMSIASHQLRTPLTSIKGYLSMLLDGDMGKVTPDQHKVLDEAYRSSERMVSLITDFLNVSRLQTGKFIIDHIETDLRKVVQDEVDSLRQSAASRSLSLRLHVTHSHIPLLYIDETKIRQCIMNFIDNAIYYSSPNTTIHIHLDIVRSNVEFFVKDTGIGVPADQQDRLFTKFFRATNAHKRRPDGTGVGLFLAKKVIDGHGGEIIFHSQENKGSTFGFMLPVQPLSKPMESGESA